MTLGAPLPAVQAPELGCAYATDLTAASPKVGNVTLPSGKVVDAKANGTYLVVTLQDQAGLEALRTFFEQGRLDQTVASCGSIDLGLAKRAPDSYAGQCGHFYGEVTQFDMNTGSCAFRAELSNRPPGRYGVNDGTNSILTAPTKLTCSQLDVLREHDLIEVWALGTGSQTYDTQIGGRTTALTFATVRVNRVGRNALYT